MRNKGHHIRLFHFIRENENSMIKFFRKIRQRLLTEDKFSKYLIYAIGEIFLLVPEVLTALQIKNYDEYKKNCKYQLKWS